MRAVCFVLPFLLLPTLSFADQCEFSITTKGPGNIEQEICCDGDLNAATKILCETDKRIDAEDLAMQCDFYSSRSTSLSSDGREFVEENCSATDLVKEL